MGQPNNEEPTDFFRSEPDILVDASQVLIPPVVRPGEVSPAYTNGLVSVSIPGFAAADLAAGTLRSFASSGDEGAVVFSTRVGVGFSDTLTPLATGVEHFDLVVGRFFGSGDGGAWFAVDDDVLKGTRGEHADGPEGLVFKAASTSPSSSPAGWRNGSE
jgi:hypothetical protein